MEKENKDKLNETEETKTVIENTIKNKKDIRGEMAIKATKKEKKTTLSEDEKKRFIYRKLNGINNKKMTGRLERTARNLYNLK